MKSRIALAVLLLMLPWSALRADDELGKRASWSMPELDAVKAQVAAWTQSRSVDELARQKIEAIWSVGDDGNVDLLGLVALTIAATDESAAELLRQCDADARAFVWPEASLLDDDQADSFARANLRLFVGRWLAQHELFDEAIQQLQGLEAGMVVDPTSLFFYQGVCFHRLLKKEECLASTAKLLENEHLLPRRYLTVAQLMTADLKPLKPDSLDEVSRLMDDVRRRLNLARAGKRVRDQEDEIVAKLDKLIEQLEQQQQQQQQASSDQAQGRNKPNQPAPDSAQLQGKGPGDVDPKDHPIGDQWGNLPPKERQEALQRITRELPAHYREVIEEYFRKLARDNDK